ETQHAVTESIGRRGGMMETPRRSLIEPSPAGLVVALFVLVVAGAIAAVTPHPAHGAVTPGGSPTAIQELPEGTMLTKENWEIAKGHLPDEILELYKRGDYSHPIRK